MANSYSTADLIKGVLTNSGERTDTDSPYKSLALKFLNDVYKQLLSGANIFDPEIGDAWTWARQTQTFIVPGYYDTGTITIAANATTGTFSVAPAISLERYDLQLQNANTKNWYQITEHVAGQTSFTLNTNWLDDAGSNLSFRAVPLIHNLGQGILRLCDPMRINKYRRLEYGEKWNDSGQIYGLPVLEFWKDWPLLYVQNDIPSKFTTINQSESEWLIRLNRYPTEAMKIDFDFIAIPAGLVDSTQDIPLVPYQWRSMLEYGAAFFLNTVKGQGERATTMFNMAKTMLRAMHLQEEKTNKSQSVNFGQITPRLDNSGNPWWLVRPW